MRLPAGGVVASTTKACVPRRRWSWTTDQDGPHRESDRHRRTGRTDERWHSAGDPGAGRDQLIGGFDAAADDDLGPGRLEPEGRPRRHRREADPNGSVTVVDPNNNTETTVRRRSTITHDATTGKKLDETPALQNVGQPGSSEGETPVDDEDEPANDTSERSSTRTGRAKSLIRTGRARAGADLRTTPTGRVSCPRTR